MRKASTTISCRIWSGGHLRLDAEELQQCVPAASQAFQRRGCYRRRVSCRPRRARGRRFALAAHIAGSPRRQTAGEQGYARPVNKGMLVQSKWDYALRHASERRRLRDQSRDMLARTQDAYVWVYEDTGVAVVPATVAASPIRPIPLQWPRRTVGELVADGLRCTAGDHAIGRNLDQPIVPSLNTMLERLSAETAMEFVVEPSG
jgi:hypothetical protein